jgi:acyl-CoA thioesterase-1
MAGGERGTSSGPSSWLARSLIGSVVVLVAIALLTVAIIVAQHPPRLHAAADRARPVRTRAASAQPLAHFLGDSYTFGYGATSRQTALPMRIAAGMGWRADVDGVSGTGYLNPATGTNDTYPDRASHVPAGARYVVIMGGVNDYARFAASPTAFVRAANTTAAPRAKLIVVGPFWPYAPTDSRITAMDAIVENAAATHGALFLDALRERWMTDPGVAGHMTDKLHPNQQGYDALAARIDAALKERLR